jgi:hypothetical protein
VHGGRGYLHYLFLVGMKGRWRNLIHQLASCLDPLMICCKWGSRLSNVFRGEVMGIYFLGVLHSRLDLEQSPTFNEIPIVYERKVVDKALRVRGDR